jgi:hypothetical protein
MTAAAACRQTSLHATMDLIMQMHELQCVHTSMFWFPGRRSRWRTRQCTTPPQPPFAIAVQSHQNPNPWVQVAVAYAAMHDTPARMLAVGVLRGIVPWRRARAFFVARLRRRWVLLRNVCYVHIEKRLGSTALPANPARHNVIRPAVCQRCRGGVVTSQSCACKQIN